MKSFAKIRELKLGEYSALQEFRRNPEYFHQTFLDPESFSLDDLVNSGDFIIVGRKGAGKSSCCIALGVQKEKEGYSHKFLSFNDDIGREQLQNITTSQSIDWTDLKGIGKLYDTISELYDFREVWKRKVLFSIAESRQIDIAQSLFAKFCFENTQVSKNLTSGLLKNMKLNTKISGSIIEKIKRIGDILLEQEMELPLAEFNNIALMLLKDECAKHYFFFDELNISTLQTKSDEFDLKLALVKDIIRASNELNEFFHIENIDCHVICSLRPEVRDQINSRDPEMSKIMDSNFVNLSWGGKTRINHPLMKILKKKVVEGVAPETELATGFFPEFVSNQEANGEIETYLYVLNLSWYRPRDVVRMLKCYQKTNGSDIRLFGGDMPKFLKEYSRISAVESLAELTVKYGETIVSNVLGRMNKRYYDNKDELLSEFEVLKNRLDSEELITDLFHAGVILNIDKIDGRTVFFASYRDDSRLDPNLNIMVHRGLWYDFHLIS